MVKNGEQTGSIGYRVESECMILNYRHRLIGGEWEQDAETKWFDQMFLTKPEAEHVRRLVLDDLQAQGHLEMPTRGHRGDDQPAAHKTPEGEDVSEYYSNGADEDIPF